jgi:hypothetical protein
VPARRKAVFLDTCYSGQALRPGEKALAIEGTGVGAATARLFVSGEGTYVITSSQGDERSYESDELANGYFTHFLIAALSRSEEPATLSAVFGISSKEVPAAVARDKNARQTPQMVPVNGPGDLRIGVAPAGDAVLEPSG